MDTHKPKNLSSLSHALLSLTFLPLLYQVLSLFTFQNNSDKVIMVSNGGKYVETTDTLAVLNPHLKHRL